MDWSLLILLLCPLMMIGMMFFMRQGHGSQSQKNLERLKAQQQQLAAELEELKTKG